MTSELGREVETFSQTLREAYGAKLWMSVKSQGDAYEKPIVTIESIVIPEERRGGGSGTHMMGEIIGWANRNEVILSLHPTTDLGATSVSRLRKFYRRFGFVPNKGRAKDFRTRDAMIRYPRTTKTNPSQDVQKARLMR